MERELTRSTKIFKVFPSPFKTSSGFPLISKAVTAVKSLDRTVIFCIRKKRDQLCRLANLFRSSESKSDDGNCRYDRVRMGGVQRRWTTSGEVAIGAAFGCWPE